MKTTIDPTLCTACGLCVDDCPEVYEMRDECAVVIGESVPADQEECAKEAEESCPVEAISHK